MHVRALVREAAARRGMRPPLSEEDADVADPYLRDDAAFEGMSAQVLAVLPSVAAALSPGGPR